MCMCVCKGAQRKLVNNVCAAIYYKLQTASKNSTNLNLTICSMSVTIDIPLVLQIDKMLIWRRE